MVQWMRQWSDRKVTWVEPFAMPPSNLSCMIRSMVCLEICVGKPTLFCIFRLLRMSRKSLVSALVVSSIWMLMSTTMMGFLVSVISFSKSVVNSSQKDSTLPSGCL